MFYYLYKITNLVNNKIYVGVHKTMNINDGYMGSGKVIKDAIQKYGINNFKKDILETFEDSESMYAKEKQIVNEEFLSRDDVYNLRRGGHGGFDYLNSNGLNTQWKDKNSKQLKTSISLKQKWKNDPNYALALRAVLGVRSDNFIESAKQSFSGRSHTNNTREKMRNSAVGKHNGNKNSQFGSMWITNGNINKKINKTDSIPDGWRKGRVL